MKLADDFKLLYSKAENNTRQLFAAADKIPTLNDKEVDILFNGEAGEVADYKLIYEKNGSLYSSTKLYPTESDVTVECLVDNKSIFSTDDIDLNIN